MSLRAEHRRIKSAFSALLVLALPAAAAAAIEACGDAETRTRIDAKDSAIEPDFPDDATVAKDDVTVAADAAASADARDVGVDAPVIDLCAAPSPTVFYIDEDGGALADAPIDGEPDAQPSCQYSLPCGFNPDTALSGCQLSLIYAPDAQIPLDCWVIQPTCDQDVYVPSEAGVTFRCGDCVAGGGRGTSGVRRVPAKQVHFASREVNPAKASGAINRAKAPRGGDRLGAYLAALAVEEAVSVHAFARMRVELAFHGAPQSLVRAAARAERDEIRHARVIALHARRAKGSVPSARARRAAGAHVRSLGAIARENAREGCVRETFGALLLAWQAARAEEPALRRSFSRIAKDEAKHAALSWELASWCDARLSPRATERVRKARRAALVALESAVNSRMESIHDRSLGHPSKREALALLAGMRESFEL